VGPTTVALLHFFRADRAFIEAKQALEAATRDVRIQETRVNQLKTDHDTTHNAAIGFEAKAREVESELKAREARIELLRQRQTNATNPKEYQALIVEINTQKLDKGKLEESALAQIDKADAQKKAATELKARFEAETSKLKQMKAEINDRVRALTAEMEALRAPRDAAAASVPASAMSLYRRAAERFEDEALAHLEKPSLRDQEYLCSGCNTYMVADTYNRLRNTKRDDVVTCPTCTRILYIPEEMTVELALSTKVKAPKKAASGETKKRAPRKKAGDMNAIEAAIAAGSASARGKGPKDTRKASEAPLPSTADGMSNVGTDQPVMDDANEQAGEQANEQAAESTAHATPGETSNS
jgi:uncharacterized protein